MDELMQIFYRELEGIDFGVYGIFDTSDTIHTLGTDSKIIGRVFEMYLEPVVARVAARFGLQHFTPEAQTHYPDFVLLNPTHPYTPDKIALDVKTTYITTPGSAIKFTLGAFGSYMRDNNKNIAFPYTDFVKHYVIGIVYRRNAAAQASAEYPFAQRGCITPPFSDVRCFIQEKYKIAGDKPGSGNTENIGSISTNNFDAFVYGYGPFSELGQDVYDIYWKYYPKYRSLDRPYTSLQEFFAWIPANIHRVELFRPINKDDIMQRIQSYRYTHQV